MARGLVGDLRRMLQMLRRRRRISA